MGLVFLGCFPKAMAMQWVCPFLCPFLTVVAASCQPNKKEPPLQGLCAQALGILKGGCSPKRWRWSAFKHCMETTTVSPLLGRALVPHTILSDGDGQEGYRSNFSVESCPGWPTCLSLYICLTMHAPKFQAPFPSLLTVLGKELAPTAGSLQFLHLQISVFTASQISRRAALVSILEVVISCSCLGKAAELSTIRFIIWSVS